MIAHALGRYAIAANRNDPSVLSQCRPTFQAGCYHGVLEGYMLTYGADFFLLRPGRVVLALGLMIILAGAGGLRLGPIVFSIYWSLFGLTLAVVGLQSFYLGCIVQVSYGYSEATADRWLRLFEFNRAMLGSALLFGIGVLLSIPLVVSYVESGYRLDGVAASNRLAIVGLFLLIASFLTFSSTLVIHASAMRARPRRR